MVNVDGSNSPSCTQLRFLLREVDNGEVAGPVVKRRDLVRRFIHYLCKKKEDFNGIWLNYFFLSSIAEGGREVTSPWSLDILKMFPYMFKTQKRGGGITVHV